MKRIYHGCFIKNAVGTNKIILADERCFSFIFFFILCVLLFIVNNGNILTDGRDERKYIRRKYNEL